MGAVGHRYGSAGKNEILANYPAATRTARFPVLLNIYSVVLNERWPMLLIFLVRIIELMFFSGIAGCVVTIVASWYSIFKDEFTT